MCGGVDVLSGALRAAACPPVAFTPPPTIKHTCLAMNKHRRIYTGFSGDIPFPQDVYTDPSPALSQSIQTGSAYMHQR